MSIFEAVKQSVTTRQAAERYGIRVERNGMCRCPFHDDSTPSMKLDRRYYCFGCGATGDVIDFVSRLRGIGSKEAATLLAQDFAIPYEDGTGKMSKPRQQNTDEQNYKHMGRNRTYPLLSAPLSRRGSRRVHLSGAAAVPVGRDSPGISSRLQI